MKRIEASLRALSVDAEMSPLSRGQPRISWSPRLLCEMVSHTVYGFGS